MAFQMIPPRLSSSPPPLDSLPPVTCPGVDEDDEFDHFSSHNASFDITVKQSGPQTAFPEDKDKACAAHLPSENVPQHEASGLSDKLPPTPESSPTRLPGVRLGPGTERGLTEGLEGALEDSISQDSGVDSSNHPHEFSPQPQGDSNSCSREDSSLRPDRELSDTEQNDVDEFGDFQGVCMAGSEAPEEGEQKCFGNTAENTQGWNSQVSSQLPSQGSESCVLAKESDASIHRADHSPPPLDCVKDSVIEDGFASSFPHDDDDDDDVDFGDFSSHDAVFDQPSGAKEEKCSSESSLHPHDSQPVLESMIENEQDKTASGNIQLSSTTERSQGDGDLEDEDAAYKPSRGGSDNEQEENFASLPPKGSLRQEDETQWIPITSEDTQTPTTGDEVEAADRTTSSQGKAREESEMSTVVAPTTSASDSNGEERTGDGSGLEKGSPSLGSNESEVLESDSIVKESKGDVDLPTNVTERLEVSKDDSECDFGDFNQAEGGDDDGDDDDDDDLDFADLRKQVEEGTFGDFGDFNSGFGDGNDGGGDGGGDGGDGDDFGDFTASADAETRAEFDDFGDFVVHGKESAVDGDFSQDFDGDDFGDFNAPENSEALQGFTAAAGDAPQLHLQDDGVCKSNPILQKLESLVTKWIPKTAGTAQEESHVVPLLHQAVESDAFVWRQLENLESSAALRLSWGNTQAHNFFLSSVNVDARNILFGQKWSSSVPLFAQTLSFSPLTPAKSTEGAGGGGTGGGGSGGVGLAGGTKDLPPDSFPAATAKPRQHKNSGSDWSSLAASGGSEEQIPPAKFDWTSSGLTNPLEGPAYSSSLFGLDLLLTNTKIGKGATNALLASLEQEFLSEGGDKATGGRAAKTPPTPSPLVQQILGRGMSKVPSPATPLQSLSPEVRQVVTQLPDLSFMRSRVLMFPIRGEQ